MKLPSTYLGLLRGINVGGHHKLPMADLRALLTALGWSRVRTYIQSGNAIFEATDSPAVVEARLEQAIKRTFGLAVPVLVRTATAWSTYAAGNPFSSAVKTEPNRVLLALAKQPLPADAADVLQERGTRGERIVQVEDALWIHFPQGIAQSRLTSALLDRVAGSPVTARNWLTVVKLRELSEPRET